MFKMKGTKRSLLMSALALLLCVSMLIGSTFAWFTDSVTSEGNIIKSGSLKISMKWADGKEDPETTTAWKDASKNPIFNYDKWEPGYTEARHIAVKNEGTLALKYQMTIVPNGEVSKLAEVIDVYYIEDGEQIDDRADLSAYKPVGTLADLIDNGLGLDKIPSGSLVAGASFTATLVLKMQESAGNEYQNLSIGSEFAIQLLATQLTKENDSYGPDYDEDAWMDGMQVFTPDDLQTAINLGKDPVLQANIELEKPIEIPAPAASTFSLRATPDATVINLNGHKLVAGDDGYVVNNENGGTLVIADATGKGVVEGVVYTDKSTTTIDGGTYNAVDGAKFVLLNSSGTLTINGGTINGGSSYPVYSYDAGHKLVINDATVNASFGCVNIYGIDGYAEINGGTFNMTGVAGKTSHIAYFANGTAVINGGNFNKIGDVNMSATGGGGICAIYGANLTIKGGNFAGDYADIYNWGGNNDNGESVKISVEGGTFKFEPKGMVAEGFKVVANTDGSYTVLFPQESLDSIIDNAVAGDTVAIPAGTYTFPTSKLEAGMTLECAEGTVFEGTTKLNINGATVIGATFSNPDGIAVDQTINGTFKDCVFEGSETLRWCYTVAGDTAVFENCEFKTDFRGIHFDAMDGDVIFRNCKINGFNAIGGNGTVTFEKCTFGNDASKYNGLNMYSNITLTDCTFNFVSGKTNFIDMEGTGKTLTISDCTATLDGKAANILDFVGGSKLAQNTVVYEGVAMTFVSSGLFTDANGNYYVSNAAGLAELNAKMVNKTAGKNAVVNLISDIDFAGKTWITVDSHADTAFSLKEINGNGHTISNLTVNGQAMFSRFSGVGDVVIKDITFDGAAINSTALNSSILTVQAYQNVLLDNVDVKNSTITGSYKVAPLIATVYNEKESTVTATLKNCDVSNTTVTSNLDFMVTGLVAFVNEGNNDKIVFENCTLTDVTLTANSKGYNAMAAVYCNDGSAEGSFDEVAGVVVKNVTKN